MTARQPPRPNGLNAAGNGKGLKKTTRVAQKKRGANALRVEETIAENRKKYVSLSQIPTAQVTELYDPDKPLTEKMKLLIKYWAQGDSIMNATIRAGYAEAGIGYKIVKTPQALALYDEEKRLYAESCQMTRKRVMEGFLDSIEMAKLLAEPASMVAGWREIGKMCGYYEPVRKKIDLTVNGSVVMERMNRLSDAELLKVIQQGLLEDESADEDAD